MPTLKAQSISVIGGNGKAFDCYQHALLTDAFNSVITTSMLEDCDFALENVLLNRRDKAATFTNRAILKYRRENYQQAFADFESAISLQPEIAEIYVNRGNAYYMTGEYALALSLGISEVHALYLNTGMAYEKLGNTQQARDSYERAWRSRQTGVWQDNGLTGSVNNEPDFSIDWRLQALNQIPQIHLVHR